MLAEWRGHLLDVRRAEHREGPTVHRDVLRRFEGRFQVNQNVNYVSLGQFRDEIEVKSELQTKKESAKAGEKRGKTVSQPHTPASP